MAKKKTTAESEFAKSLGERIAMARKRKSFKVDYSPLTQQELSELSGIDVNSIHLYETGAVTPKAYALKKLAKAMKVKVDWLIGK